MKNLPFCELLALPSALCLRSEVEAKYYVDPKVGCSTVDENYSDT